MLTPPTIGIGWPKDDYLRALERAGAFTWILDPAKDLPEAVVSESDGLLLSGGADVDPKHYGAADRHPSVSTEPARDAFELVLARLALAADVPILAICRGVQLMNVAAGGTLVQDLPSERPSAVSHRIREPLDELAHSVSVVPDSTLGTLMDEGVVAVNSRHHQAVRDVAPGFVVTATAEDGVIEAIERPGASFCIGVQWHPENFWRTGQFDRLFEAFIEAARDRRAKRP